MDNVPWSLRLMLSFVSSNLPMSRTRATTQRFLMLLLIQPAILKLLTGGQRMPSPVWRTRYMMSRELCSILLCWYTKQCILYRVKGLHMYKLCSIAVLLHMLSNTVFQTNTIKGEFSVVIATTFSLRPKQQSRVALAAAVVELQNVQNMIKYRNFYTCPGSVWSQLCFQCNRCPWGGTISCKQWWPCYTQRAEHHWLFR